MKVVIAIDSLKGSLSSMEAGNAAAAGIRRVNQEAEVVVRPLADGGEGTMEALLYGVNGTSREITVSGPLGKPVQSSYGISADKRTAIIEIACAAGLTLVPEAQRNPLDTTTYGVGEVIKDAIRLGCRRFIIGLGGSATNDGGIGMLQALGYEFLNKQGKAVSLGAKGLAELTEIRSERVLAELQECSFTVACDVNNPLCGTQGCSAVYGPQKGAVPEMIEMMDGWLGDYAALAGRIFPAADPLQPGAGAAGGLGFAFLTFLNSVLESGINIVLKETGLESALVDADLVITGEGRLDEQTAMGKAPVGVAKLAKQYGACVVALAGSVTKGAGACNENGIDAFFPILRRISTLAEAMAAEQARENLADTAEQVFRLWSNRADGSLIKTKKPSGL